MRDVVCRTCGEIPRAREVNGELVLACACDDALVVAPIESAHTPEHWAGRVSQ